MRKFGSGISVSLALVALGSAVMFAVPAGAAVRHHTATSSSSPIVAVIEAGTSTGGFWTVQASGQVTAHNGGVSLGAPSNLSSPVIAAAATGAGAPGYWLATAAGQVYSFGAARFWGDLAAKHLVTPVVGIAAHLDAAGYSLITARGSAFSFPTPPSRLLRRVSPPPASFVFPSAARTLALAVGPTLLSGVITQSQAMALAGRVGPGSGPMSPETVFGDNAAWVGPGVVGRDQFWAFASTLEYAGTGPGDQGNLADAPLIATASHGCHAMKPHLKSSRSGLIVVDLWCDPATADPAVTITDTAWPAAFSDSAISDSPATVFDAYDAVVSESSTWSLDNLP